MNRIVRGRTRQSLTCQVKRDVCFAHMMVATFGVDTAFQVKGCQPFYYDSPGTLERGTQLYFLR